SLLEELINKPSFPRGLLALIYRKRGRAYSSLKNYQQAIVDFDCALEFDHNYTFAYVDQGWAYNWLKGYQHAITDFDRALQLDPDYTFAYMYPRSLHDSLPIYSLLEELINKPSFPRALLALIYRRRGRAYSSLKYYQQAIVDFDHALA